MISTMDEALSQLEYMRQADSDEGVANALYRLAALYLNQKRFAEAAEPLDEAYYLCKKLENWSGLAAVCRSLSRVASSRGDNERAGQLLEEALELYRGLDDQRGAANTFEQMGGVAMAQGRLEHAIDCFRRGLEVAAAEGDSVSQLLFNQYLAAPLRQLGELEQALDVYREVGRLAEKLGERQRVALALVGAGTLHAQCGRIEEGLVFLEKARSEFAGLGMITRAKEVAEEIKGLKKILEARK